MIYVRKRVSDSVSVPLLLASALSRINENAQKRLGMPMAGQKMGSPASPWLPHDLPCFLSLQDPFSGTSGGKVGGKTRRRPLHQGLLMPSGLDCMKGQWLSQPA